MDRLVFQNAPIVEFGTNIFSNCPTILQFDEDPLIQIVRMAEAGFSTQIPIYHEDGTYLAKVVGSRIHATPAGTKAGISLSHPDKMTVCTLGNKTLFEITRKDAASLKTTAELHTSSGYFVRYAGSTPLISNSEGGALQVGGLTISGSKINGFPIGVLMKSDGSVIVGCNQHVTTNKPRPQIKV